MHEASGRAGRPAVSVITPFLGTDAEARWLLESLRALNLREGDELIVSDNTATGIMVAADPHDVTVVSAKSERSSYHSRNVGALQTSNEWLLFMDSDCRPIPDLLDLYFGEPVADAVGAVTGPIRPLLRSERATARYAASRMGDEQSFHMRNAFRPFAATANLLVRREAWESVGGFLEGVRSGADADFGWRLQELGWQIEYRPEPAVRHLMREELRAYLRVHARYAAGRHWIQRRWPASDMGPKVTRVFRLSAAFGYRLLTARLERALFNLIDLSVVASEGLGYLAGNRAPRPDSAPTTPLVVIMVDRFPEVSETFVAAEARALQRAGRATRVEARLRPLRPALGGSWGLDVLWEEDVGFVQQHLDWVWLLTRHPLRCLADLLRRRRWKREEPVPPLRQIAQVARRVRRDRAQHLHVHFARRSALIALRLQRLIRVPFSLTVHAFDVFKEPTNLRAKLDEARFVRTVSGYNATHLRELLDESSAAKVHVAPMGVDPNWFRRTAREHGEGRVLAVGRLIEKKGFEHLITATAHCRDSGLVREVVIVGDGRLSQRLRRQAQELGVETLITFAGVKRPEEIRQLMQECAILVMPSVIARDGDRDGLPVAVQEALAMELPVVASDEVGLPELVSPEWGRLVTPGDPEELARTITELLSLSPEVRREMGRRGRAFVERRFDIDQEVLRLIGLIDACSATDQVDDHR